MSDRGMKKWAPYASLIEQASYVRRIKLRHRMVQRPHLSSDQANHIEQILMSPIRNPYQVTYFSDGAIHHALLNIKQVDSIQKTIIFDTHTIAYRDLLDIEPFHQ